MDPIAIATVVVSAVFGLGLAREFTTRRKALKDQGQNDITESECPKLCLQLRARWNEFCLARGAELAGRVCLPAARPVVLGARGAGILLGEEQVIGHTWVCRDDVVQHFALGGAAGDEAGPVIADQNAKAEPLIAARPVPLVARASLPLPRLGRGAVAAGLPAHHGRGAAFFGDGGAIDAGVGNLLHTRVSGTRRHAPQNAATARKASIAVWCRRLSSDDNRNWRRGWRRPARTRGKCPKNQTSQRHGSSPVEPPRRPLVPERSLSLNQPERPPSR